MIEIRWNKEAELDIMSIYAYLADLDVVFAENFSDSVLLVIEQVKKFSEIG
jgi:plasmid stabilization system protein ParE